jgi:hypothetical protein
MGTTVKVRFQDQQYTCHCLKMQPFSSLFRNMYVGYNTHDVEYEKRALAYECSECDGSVAVLGRIVEPYVCSDYT